MGAGKSSSKFYSNFLQKILSVKNDLRRPKKTYKAITVLGFKIKFKIKKIRKPKIPTFSLGCNCHTTVHLKHLGLRTCAYPLDWINCIDDTINIETRLNMLTNGFKDFFNRKDLVLVGWQWKNQSIAVYNLYTGFSSHT